MLETNAAVAWLTTTKGHPYEDRYRLLDARVPLVAKLNRGFVYAVVDGIGGSERPTQAAQAVVDVLVSFFKGGDGSLAALTTLLVNVDREIHAWGNIQNTTRPLGGAAATIVWLAPDARLNVLHAGDTRALLVDGDRPVRLTQEHGGGGNTIRNYFGLGAVQLDIGGRLLEEGDLVCLVTDGVTKVMDDGAIARAVFAGKHPEGAAREVVQRARNLKGSDDITCLIVEVEAL